MKHKSARSLRVMVLATGLVLLGTSASFAQCMAGGQGMASAGPGMMGGPRMMGMGATGTGTASAGASMMSLQQAMQMAQMVQHMRNMQIERLRMIETQRNRQAAQQPRNRRAGSRQVARAGGTAGAKEVAANIPQDNEENLGANPSSQPQPANGPAKAKSLRNRQTARSRAN